MPALLPSELPELARVRHHWIVLFRLPHRLLGLALLILFVIAFADPFPAGIVFVLVLAGLAFLRWQTWQAECVILTSRRIIRLRGVPETTSSESSIRIDRISGAVLEQTVLGKILNYGSIELEAPGQHPDVRLLVKIAAPNEFYLKVRRVVFGSASDLEPADHPQDFLTAPLPVLPPSQPPYQPPNAPGGGT